MICGAAWSADLWAKKRAVGTLPTPSAFRSLLKTDWKARRHSFGHALRQTRFGMPLTNVCRETAKTGGIVTVIESICRFDWLSRPTSVLGAETFPSCARASRVETARTESPAEVPPDDNDDREESRTLPPRASDRWPRVGSAQIRPSPNQLRRCRFTRHETAGLTIDRHGEQRVRSLHSIRDVVEMSYRRVAALSEVLARRLFESEPVRFEFHGR